MYAKWRNFNFYGPTEATIYCTFYKVPRLNIKSHNGMLSIGKPMKNVIAKILDPSDQEVDSYEKGELCISTRQLTTGYWKNLNLNTKVFLKIGERRFYRTGDLCYRDNSNFIYLLGRKDDQVKIDGFRIELGEIEFKTKEIIKKEAVVIAKKQNNKVQLILFVQSNIDLTEKVLVELKEKLPYYMIPNKVICIEKFPLNQNNKIDKVNLKDRV